MSAASDLRALHVPGDPLVLPNAWDAATARLVQEAGYPVVATTSSGVAEALGYADREVTPVDEMLAAVARIARVVAIPVTADLEGGYGLEPAELAERTVAAGASGLTTRTRTIASTPVSCPSTRRRSGSPASRPPPTSSSTPGSTPSSAAGTSRRRSPVRPPTGTPAPTASTRSA